MSSYLISEETLTQLANKIRTLYGITDSLSTEDILFYLDLEKSNMDLAFKTLENKGLILPNQQNSESLISFMENKIILPHKINFNAGILYAPSETASFTPVKISGSSIDFLYIGGSGTEQLLFPIEGLIPGHTYTLNFEESYNGTFIEGSYTYGCGYLDKKDYESIDFPITSGTIINERLQWTTTEIGTKMGSFTFTPNSSSGYWLWSLSLIKDNTQHNIKFSAEITL